MFYFQGPDGVAGEDGAPGPRVGLPILFAHCRWFKKIFLSAFPKAVGSKD